MMDKSSVKSIVKHILSKIRKYGDGYYCILDRNYSIFDIYSVIEYEGEIEMLMLGTTARNKPAYLADSLADDVNIIDFVHLNEILMAQYREKTDNF